MLHQDIEPRTRADRRAAMRKAKKAAGATLTASSAALATTAALVGGGATPVGAATLVVTNLNDDGPGSLRETIDNAASGDVITFDSTLSGTITLTTGQLEVFDKDLTITGPGAGVLTVSGNDADRVFYLVSTNSALPNDFTISGLTIRDGDPFCGCPLGGGVASVNGNLNLDSVVVTENAADAGGGVAFDAPFGVLEIRDSVISGNEALAGGGVYVDDAGSAIPVSAGVDVSGSTVTGNEAYAFGGGLMLAYVGSGADIAHTTISGNTAGIGGGAFVVDLYGVLQVGNTTISGNAAAFGAGIQLGDLYDVAAIFNSTISGNTGTGIGYAGNFEGLYLVQDTITDNTTGVAPMSVGEVQAQGIQSWDEIRAENQQRERNPKAEPRQGKGRVDAQAPYTTELVGTIIAGNGGAFDIDDFDTVNSTNSLVGSVNTANTTFNDLGGTLVGVDPELGPLVDNGGQTRTHALLNGSPAIGAGPNPVPNFPSNSTDQRGDGFARVVDGRVDIGAFERQSQTGTVATPCGDITVTTSSGELHDLEAEPVPADPPAPADIVIPCELITFRIVGLAPGASTTITVTTPVAVDDYWKLQHDEWTKVTGAHASGTSVTFTLTDGGPFDADGAADGFITDPGAPTQTAQVPPAPTVIVTPTFTG